MSGKILNARYALGRLLGQGGTGAVYEAEDQEREQRVAVKLISPDVARTGSVGSRVEREARAAGSVTSEHIARLLDAGTDAETGAPFLVMELLHGEDLGQLLGRIGPLKPEVALRIGAQACAGLKAAHAAGIVHRDIKPANLFMARREGAPDVTVKILDFGIAKIMQASDWSAETTGLTRTGAMLGTPLYMSPEQARGLKSVDHRSDVWSLGVVLYRALSGRAPNEDIEGFGDMIAMIITEEPQPLQELAPWVPPGIASVVHTALARDPAGRYQSAADMLAAIEPLLGDQGAALDDAMLVPLDEAQRTSRAPKLELTPTTGSAQRQTSPSRANTPPTRLAPPQQAPVQGAAKGRVPSRLTAAAGGLAAALLGGLAIYWIVGPTPGHDTPAPTPPATAAPRDSAPRRIQLVILPSDANVQVDGAPARAKDGIVEIEGTLGSVHPVRVEKDGIEIEGDVVVTETGALPPKLELKSTSPSPDKPSGPADPKRPADVQRRWD